TKNLIAPAIYAAPSQTKGDGWRGKPNAVCVGTTAALWGAKIDMQKLVTLIKSKLPSGITVSSISFTGHSGAGCSYNTGIHKALKQFPNMYAVGQFDTCTNGGYGSSMKAKLGPNTKATIVFAGSMAARGKEQEQTLGITKKIDCPATSVQMGETKDCKSDVSDKLFSYWMKNLAGHAHSRAVIVGMEQFLLKHFPNTGTTTQLASHTPSTSTAGCVQGQRVIVMGDSITNAGGQSYGYVTKLDRLCSAVSFTARGVNSEKTTDILKRWERDVESQNYNTVMILAGVNDINAGRGAQYAINGLTQMYTKAKAKNMRVIALTIMPWRYGGWTQAKMDQTKQVNTWIKSQQGTLVDQVIDIYAAMDDPANPTNLRQIHWTRQRSGSYDKLHPNSKGHTEMANAIWKAAFLPPATQTA
ncbi:SGNH/GDSL hydrolase family protein, partial [Nanoarchaeota archaeon]